MSDSVIPNLWPENIGTQAHVTPVAILRRQAVNLGDRTQNIVSATVESHQATSLFEHTFVVFAPLLGYRFPLFHVRHGLDGYPVRMWESEFLTGKSPSGVFDTSKVKRLKNEKEFLSALKNTFNSESVRKVIESFIAQSTSADAAEGLLSTAPDDPE